MNKEPGALPATYLEGIEEEWSEESESELRSAVTEEPVHEENDETPLTKELLLKKKVY